MPRLTCPNYAMLLTIAISTLFAGCADQLPTAESDFATADLARVKTDDPTVDAVDPTSAPQDTTLDLEVIGTGYDDGSTVTLKRGGKPIKEIVTNNTKFVSPQKLVANITIALEADTGQYDVEVLTARKRPGVGTEMFTVLKTDNGVGPSIEVEVSDWTGLVWSPAGIVLGEITQDGRFWANTAPSNSGTNTPPARELCMNLSHVNAVLAEDDYQIFVSQVSEDGSSTGMASVCSEVTMHTRDHSHVEKMRGQSVGSIEYSGGKIVLEDFATGRDTWEWRLLWDAAPSYIDSLATDLSLGVCIDHPNEDVWHLYNDDDVTDPDGSACVARGIEIDNAVELWRVYIEKPRTAVWVHVAEFEMPFRFRITRLSSD